MNKKNIILLLALLLIVSVVSVACKPKDEKPASTSSNNTEIKEKEKEKKSSVGQIIIGSTTEFTGDWIKYSKSNPSDYEIYQFIRGMNTIAIKPDGRYEINKTVIEKSHVEENEDKSKTYTFTIRDGLKYEDGTEIRAKDYVASVMIWSLAFVQDAGVGDGAGIYLKGYEDFSKGTVKEFSGVNLISEKEFSLTIAAENLPYFYELSAVESSPTKLEFWVDDLIDIKDDGDGVYFSENLNLEEFKKSFNVARKEVENFPSTGAYKLVSYDKNVGKVVLKVNKNFPGDYTGQKPKIKKIVYKKVEKEKALKELEKGSIDLLSQVSDGENIKKGLTLAEESKFDYTQYPRAGYGKLVFQTDFGPTQYIEVRKAIAYLMDRKAAAKTFTDGYGKLIEGPYTEQMWFYGETKSELEEKLNKYEYNIETAKELLENGGWIFDKDGNVYREGIRYKRQNNGEFIPLKIELASPERSLISDILLLKLQENPDVKEAGMEIKQTIMSFDEVLLYMYRDGEKDRKYEKPKFGMYNLAEEFTPKYDLSKNYTRDPEMLEAGYNINFLLDEQLESTAKAMVELNPQAEEQYKENFVEFVIRWNELLPDIPLYSNMYYDFFNKKLKNYEINSFKSISEALLYADIEEK